MNRYGRLVAFGILAATLLVAHALVAPTVYTFVFGDSTSATIAGCVDRPKSGPVCDGTWQIDGRSHSGAVTGAGTFDEGSTIAIRTSALGTYTDNFHQHFWVRGFMAVACDLGLLFAVGWISVLSRRGTRALARLRTETGGSDRLFTCDAKGISELDGARHYAVAEVDSRTTRLLDGLGGAAWTLTGERLPRDLGRITVSRAAVEHGRIERYRSAMATNMYDASGEHIGVIGYKRQYGVPGDSVMDRTGAEVALTFMAGRRIVARIPRDAPEWWRVLVFAHLVAGGWLTAPGRRR